MVLCVAWPRALYPVAPVMPGEGQGGREPATEKRGSESIPRLRAQRAQVPHNVKSYSPIITVIK